jgi:hypothetical protein
LPAASTSSQQTEQGASVVIQEGESTSLTPPDAYTSLLLENQGNSATTALLTVGGQQPIRVELAPATNTPLLYINDFSPGNLTVANQAGSPLSVRLLGIGVGSDAPAPLPFGVKLSLSSGEAAQTLSNPNWMNLSLSTTSNALTTFVIFGGATPAPHSTTRALVIQLNAAVASGPESGSSFDNGIQQPSGSSLEPAPGILYAATTGATYNLLYNWGASTILIANVSGATAAGAGVTLTSLG